MVKTIAERLSLHLPDFINTDDLISLGVSGLFNAIELFNLKRGVRFETYCVSRIRGSMIDGLRDMDWVPRLVRIKSHRIEKSYRQLEKTLCRKPSDFEVAKKLMIPIDDYNKLVRDSMATSIISFAYSDNDDESNTSTANMIGDVKSEDNQKELLNKQLVERIKGNLSKKERLVLEMYYYEELTMAEIGQILDITESRVSQILANLIKRLKSMLGQHKYEWLST
jgi:RNA polymerase sigma factor for flagellar operon FliA